MKKIKVTIELEMTNKYFEDEYSEIAYQLKEYKKEKKDLTGIVSDLASLAEDNACDVIEVNFEEVE